MTGNFREPRSRGMHPSLDVFERVIHFLFFFIECLHNVMKICLVLCCIPSMCIEAAKSGNKFCYTAVFNEPMVLCLRFQGPGLCFSVF